MRFHQLFINGVLCGLFGVALAAAIVYGIDREAHRTRVACQIDHAQGIPGTEWCAE